MISINSHPALVYASDFQAICKPLHLLNITCFSHVKVISASQFSGVSNNPAFTEHYLRNKYYNNDLPATGDEFGAYIFWDALNLTGDSLKMNNESAEFGVRHTFTIVEKQGNATHYYYFSTHLSSQMFNQVYVTNLDLLNLFISEFNKTMAISPLLNKAYDMNIEIEKTPNVSLSLDQPLVTPPSNRAAFLRAFKAENKVHPLTALPQQQKRCLSFLVKGLTSKEIARQLNISPRTVDHYLKAIRLNLDCRNSKELISKYKNLVES